MQTDILAKRRDRAIATILRTKEQDCDSFLPVSVRNRLRKVVLDEVNELYELCTDLMRSYQDDAAPVMNEFYLQKLLEVHQVVVGGHEPVGNSLADDIEKIEYRVF